MVIAMLVAAMFEHSDWMGGISFRFSLPVIGENENEIGCSDINTWPSTTWRGFTIFCIILFARSYSNPTLEKFGLSRAENMTTAEEKGSSTIFALKYFY